MDDDRNGMISSHASIIIIIATIIIYANMVDDQ